MKKIMVMLILAGIFAQAGERETGGSLIPTYPQYDCVNATNPKDNSISINASRDLKFWEVYKQIADDEYQVFPLKEQQGALVSKVHGIVVTFNTDHTASAQLKGTTYSCQSVAQQQ